MSPGASEISLKCFLLFQGKRKAPQQTRGQKKESKEGKDRGKRPSVWRIQQGVGGHSRQIELDPV